MTEWHNRPLDRVYPVLFIDAIHVKVRDGQVTNRPVLRGHRGHRRRANATSSGSGPATAAKARSSGCGPDRNQEPRRRRRVHRGLRRAQRTARVDQHRVAAAVVQTCVIHLIRNTFRYASRRYWDEMARDLRPVYTAPTEAAATERFDEFAGKWGAPYPAIVRLWDNAWTRIRSVPGLRRRDPTRHLLDERDRVGQRPIPAGDPRSRALPDRAGRAEVPLSRHPFPGPDREGQGTLGDEVEASAQRVRDHIRRPHHPERGLTNAKAGSTVYRIVPSAS